MTETDEKWTFSFNECDGWEYDLYDTEEEATENAIEKAKEHGYTEVYVGKTCGVWKVLDRVRMDTILQILEDGDDVSFTEPLDSIIPEDVQKEAENRINEIITELTKNHLGYYIPEAELIKVGEFK